MDLLDYPYLPRPSNLPTQHDKPHAHIDVIEISSDEEEIDDGQPESSRRANKSHLDTKRSVDSDSEDEFGTQLDFFHRFLEPARKKRQKLSHSESNADFDADLWFDPDEFMQFASHDDPQSAYTTTATGHIQPLTEPMALQDSHPGNRNDAALPSPSVASVGKDQISIRMANLRQIEKDRLAREIAMEKQKRNVTGPPHYYDEKLETRMYCGPGYELFPIVLGTVPEHEDICNEWDQQHFNQHLLDENAQVTVNNKSVLANSTSNLANVHKALNDTASDLELNDNELDCLCHIREVFPNIQHKFALGQIREHIQFFQRDADSDVQIQADAAVIVAQILELPTYPRQESRNQSDLNPAEDGTGFTIKWQKGDSESKSYQKDAICLLAGHFDRIPTHFISDSIDNKKSLFDTYQYLYEIEQSYDTSKKRVYKKLSKPRTQIEKKYKNTEPRSKQQWEGLVNELQAIKQHLERNARAAAKAEQISAFEDANLQEHKINGTLVECQCCFDEEIPVNRAVPCESEDMHWFCFDCVRGLAESQIGSMKHEMKCMHQGGCSAKLSLHAIQKAIPSNLVDKLAFHQQQYEITSACIEGLQQCPFCDFQAICDPIEEHTTFPCQNPDCRRVTCRICHEDNHLPKTCDEAKADRRISARHQVEEARSEAMIRSCPKCSVKIVKELGCNKMKCTKCQCVMCYVCKADISSEKKDGGYAHFHGESTNGGSRCALYDHHFDRHEAEAAEAEKEAIKRVQAENTDIDEKQLQIGTGEKARKPPPTRDEIDVRLDALRNAAAHRPAAYLRAVGQGVQRPVPIRQIVMPRIQDRPDIPIVPNFARAGEPFQPIAGNLGVKNAFQLRHNMMRTQMHQLQEMQRLRGQMGGRPPINAQNGTPAHTIVGQQGPTQYPFIYHPPNFTPAAPLGMQHQQPPPDMPGGHNFDFNLPAQPDAGATAPRQPGNFQNGLNGPLMGILDPGTGFDRDLDLWTRHNLGHLRPMYQEPMAAPERPFDPFNPQQVRPQFRHVNFGDIQPRFQYNQ